jgi:hypothetical protein
MARLTNSLSRWPDDDATNRWWSTMMMETDAPGPPSQTQLSPYGKKQAGGGQGQEDGMEEDCSEQGLADEEDEDGGLPLGDDPVVREIPVYLSTELAQQL